MLKVGITGGIGSGKSTVCQVFRTLGIPVFNADEAARYLMEHDSRLIQDITTLLGAAAYTEGKLNREQVAAIVFEQPDKLQALNALVHPATIAYGQQWLTEQTTPYSIKEAAIFYESGSNKDMDVMVGVYAPVAVRTERAMKRGAMSMDKVTAIMARQMNEEEKMSRCDHVITNDGLTAILPQILQLHQTLLNGRTATR